jgi:uncharacterized membrane protein YedE/YeeE
MVFHGLMPWWLAGPLFGLTVVSLYALANKHLGVSGGYRQVVLIARGRRAPEPWRLLFTGGLIAGAAVAAVLFGAPMRGLSYGVLGQKLNVAVLVPLLVLGGAAIGYGACWARGCTSGNGITGCATRSPGSFVATATFFGVALATTAVIRLASGGAL